jgi:hypothetical protein
MCLQYIVSIFTPPPFSLIPLPPLSQKLSTDFTVLFSLYMHKVHPPYPPSPPVHLSFPFPLVINPQTFLLLHFFKVYIDCPKGFCLGTSDMYILYFNQINSITFSLLPCLQCIPLYYLHTQMQCISVLFTIILFSSLASL